MLSCFRPPRKPSRMEELEEKFKHVLLKHFEVGSADDQITMHDVYSVLPPELSCVKTIWKFHVKDAFPESKMNHYPVFFRGIRKKLCIT